MYKKIRQSIILFIIIGCITERPEFLEAGIGVNPTTTEMVVSQGSVTKGVYTVVNESEKAIHIKVETEDWLKVRTGISSIPIENWLTITPMEFDINPRETQEVKYTIIPPSGIRGELVAMVFFGTKDIEGALGITSRIGVIIYAAIEGTINLRCKIDNIEVIRAPSKNKDGEENNGIIFIIDVRNKGNAHLRPTGDIIITGKNGAKDVVKIERGLPVFAGKKSSYAINWDKKDLSPGRYEALIILDYGNIYNIEGKVKKKIIFTLKEDGTIYR